MKTEQTRRVAVVYEDFVIVVAMALKLDGSLKANFMTCYQANNSIAPGERHRIDRCGARSVQGAAYGAMWVWQILLTTVQAS